MQLHFYKQLPTKIRWYQTSLETMSKNQQDLPYVIDSGDQPGDARLVNISNPQSSKKWLMHSPQNFFIFTLKFKSPSYVFFVQMKGLNTYKLDLTFKDHNRKFICQKSFVFETQDQLKLVEIWQHPFSTYVEVKLLNNRYSPLRMGLNYILFKGKTDPNFQPLDVEGILNHKQPNKAQIFKDRQTIKQKTGVVLQIDDQGPPKNTDIYFGDQQQNKKRHDFNPTLSLINGHLEGPTQMVAENPHQIILDPQTLPQHQQIQSVFPLTSQELQGQIIERTQLKKPYVTYAYDETREWWNILKFVRKEWVQGQKNIENQKNIAVEDRMSNKIQVKHLFRKKIMAEGLDPQRKNIIEQSGLLMGALIVAEPQPGCLVVTTREYGEKIRRMKKFKVSKVVTEEYIFNCKMFNALLNQQDYIIR